MKVTYPANIFAAYNPAIIQLKKDDNDYDIKEVSINIGENNSGKIITLKREFLGKFLKFDISKFIRNSFDDYGLIPSSKYYIDPSLSVTFQVWGDNIAMDGLAINAVKQIGESSNLTLERGSFRTNFDRLCLYKGYPNSITILGYEGKTYVAQENELPGETWSDLFSLALDTGKKYVSISNVSSDIPLATNGGEIITDNLGNIIYLNYNDTTKRYKYLETLPVPENPFYVRWINQQGGWDYWMFSFRQTIKRSIDNQQFFSPTVFDQEKEAAFIKEYFKEGSESITVGAEGLNENQYECISKLIYSPRIDYYDKEKNKWIRLIVESGENENDTRSAGKNVEFTFMLPTPQLQF